MEISERKSAPHAKPSTPVSNCQFQIKLCVEMEAKLDILTSLDMNIVYDPIFHSTREHNIADQRGNKIKIMQNL